MTNEEMERAIGFLLKSQANFEARLEQREAERARRDARIDDQFELTNQQIAETEKKLAMFADTQAEFIRVVTHTFDAQALINESQKELRQTVVEAGELQARFSQSAWEAIESQKEFNQSAVKGHEEQREFNQSVIKAHEEQREFNQSVIKGHEEQREFNQSVIKAHEEQREFNQSVIKGHEEQREFNQSVSAALTRLADSQAHTDRRLDALIDIVRGGRNGG
jgi:hypothetical protein